MDEQLFRRLCVGARFSRKDLVRERKRKSLEEKQRVETDALDAAIPKELDFFGSLARGGNPDKVDRKDSLPPPTTFHQKVPKKPIFKSPTEMHVFRKEKSIRVYGDEVPSPVRRFIDLARPEYGLSVDVVAMIKGAGLKKPTPVQMQATTVLLAGRDAFVVAPTGSGKTLVFVMSILCTLMKQRGGTEAWPEGIKALIVSPTRELAQQIRDEFRRFTPRNEGPHDKTIISSVLLNKAVLNSWEKEAPSRPPAVLVTTPQRLVQGIEKGIVDLSKVEQIILDEADRLLELGLMEQMDDILAACSFSGSIQKVLFSATIPSGVEDLARSFMNEDPVRVVIGRPNGATATIDQRLVYVGQEEGKLMALRQMLIEGIEPPVIIFTETIERAQVLYEELLPHRINVDMIHSGRSQSERETVIAAFRAGRVWFLITTELLARGLDFPDVACVINYDFPLSTASYIHRIGRTGRAGRRGRAITFYTRQDADALRIVANVMRQSGCEVPEWMLQMERKRTRTIVQDRRKRRISSTAADEEEERQA